MFGKQFTSSADDTVDLTFVGRQFGFKSLMFLKELHLVLDSCAFALTFVFSTDSEAKWWKRHEKQKEMYPFNLSSIHASMSATSLSNTDRL